jgi:trehalose/maltose hydrolase-like predicted phosphorylase
MTVPARVDRRFEAVVFDWDAAADGRPDDAERLRTLVARLSAAGLDLAVATRRPVDAVAADLAGREYGPGRVFVHLPPPTGMVEATGSGLVPVRTANGVAAFGAQEWFMRHLWTRGVHSNSVLVTADDLSMLGPILEDQLRRREEGELPVVDPPGAWRVDVIGFDPQLERVHESQLTLADGRLGTRGSPLIGSGATTPSVLLSGVYDGSGPDTELAHLPHWARFAEAADVQPARRTLDLRTGVLREDGPVTSVRFSSLARPATTAVRARGDTTLLPPTGRRTLPGRAHSAQYDRVVGDAFERLASHDPDADVAEAALAAAERVGFETLLREQREAWAARWRAADVVVEGDPELQKAIRFTLFHLMASVASDGEAAVGARGLSGPAYRGHVFWDSDIFVLPFLAATHPPAARAMLEYRIRRLPAALDIARRHGREGARFPWESAADGYDVTPSSVRMPTGEVLEVHTGEMEEHIVADVAWAAAHYLDWTGDHAFAAGPGRDLMVETARYWASRVRHDEAGRAHIDDVIGPDEYHVGVSDNAFTNVMARWNLRRAAALPGVTAEERARWLGVADAIVDGFDPDTRVYEQFAGFHGLEPILIADVAPRRPIAADLLLGTERTSQAQVIKQADVVMLHHLVPDEVEPGSLAPNLDYYEPRTSHGSSLSPAIQASLLARLGRADEALPWLRMAARMDLDDVTGSAAGGLHLATMGGVWQALAYGFAGIRAYPDRLVVDPRLPSSWTALRLRLRHRGLPLRMRITADAVTVDGDRQGLVRRVDDHWEVGAP